MEHGGHSNARIAGLSGTIVKRHLKYALELLFVPIAAAIVFIEETLLHYLGLAMAAIAKWPPVARFALHRQFGLSAASIVVGKMLATALVARLYQVLRPTLIKMAWYLRAETWLFAGRDRLYAFMRALPAWQRATALVKRVRLWMREMVFRASSR
jgi:hypothetical protein